VYTHVQPAKRVIPIVLLVDSVVIEKLLLIALAKTDFMINPKFVRLVSTHAQIALLLRLTA
jgi:hypothetical protein